MRWQPNSVLAWLVAGANSVTTERGPPAGLGRGPARAPLCHLLVEIHSRASKRTADGPRQDLAANQTGHRAPHHVIVGNPVPSDEIRTTSDEPERQEVVRRLFGIDCSSDERIPDVRRFSSGNMIIRSQGSVSGVLVQASVRALHTAGRARSRFSSDLDSDIHGQSRVPLEVRSRSLCVINGRKNKYR